MDGQLGIGYTSMYLNEANTINIVIPDESFMKIN